MTGCHAISHRIQSSNCPYKTCGRSHGLLNKRFKSTFSLQYGHVCFLPMIHQPPKRKIDKQTQLKKQLKIKGSSIIRNDPTYGYKIRGTHDDTTAWMYFQLHPLHLRPPITHCHKRHTCFVPNYAMAYQTVYSTEK